jgi:hypothetical protein
VLFVGGGTIAFIAKRKHAHKPRLLQSLLFAYGSWLLFVWYLLFSLLVPLPSWSLVMKDPTAIIADLHSIQLRPMTRSRRYNRISQFTAIVGTGLSF